MSFRITKYNIEITVVTGLYIGAGRTALRIGGVDSEFIRNPANNEPYIPGSSLKGKIRSLLEYDAGLLAVSKDGSVLNAKKVQYAKSKNIGNIKSMENILKLFGTAADSKSLKDNNEEQINYGITRLSFSDLSLKRDNGEYTEIFEVKPEVSIKRDNGKAESPRFTERVVAGTKFTGTITLKVFKDSLNNDNEEEFLKLLTRGLQLLELDALGGSSSRGYGKVSVLFDGKALPELVEN